ncbi:MAG: protein kinase [Anaeromyxobacteraceae bacterium]|nr:protein kinase [Anaeromyxobacteraceae bacterium]
MLPGHRVLLQGQSPHPWEQEAIAFIKSALPDTDPYLLWALVDYQEPSGRIAQIDALVLGYHALYVVEVKSWPGTVTGNALDWVNIRPDGHRLLKSNPYHRASEVARIVAGGLDRVWPRDSRVARPRVEALVFLSHQDVKVELPESARANLLTRATFARAITHGEIPQSGERVRAQAERHPINKPCRNATIEALRKLGLHESKSVLKLGDLLLSRAIEEGEGYQDWEAKHETIGVRRRVRLWLVPQSPTKERRDQLARAARTEAEALAALSEHRGVLRFADYRSEGPTGGPAIVFDEQEAMEPLEDFIRRRGASLPFDHRVAILEQVASALGYCHRKGVIHRNLHPGSVLVRERAGGAPETRLYNFQLATQLDGTTGTVNLSAYAPDRAALYRAPEVFENPSLARTIEADLFALGALAYYVFTGRHPGTSFVERLRLLGKDGLSLAAAADSLAGDGSKDRSQAGVEEVVRTATNPNPFERRYDTVDAWAADLLAAATEPDRPAAPEIDPLEARPLDILDGDLLVEGLLGEGSTARVFQVDRNKQSFALKVALPGADERVAAEGEALDRVRGDRIVRLEKKLTIKDRTCLLLGLAGETLGDYLGKHGPPSLDFSRRWGEDLLAALVHLEEQGVLHRDVKPANCGLTPSDAKKARRLFLFDLSLAAVPRDAIAVGTPAYRDPFLQARGRWDEAADRWSAAVTLHEMLTGSRPKFGASDAPSVTTTEELTVASDLLDPSVRGKLTAFLRRALARDVAKRFSTAEEMRTTWVSAFEAAPDVGAVATAAKVTDAELAALPATGAVDLLPLGAPARNALDRIGVRTVRDLTSISRNQLRIRGAGRETAQEILALAERLRAVRPTDDVAAPTPFFPGYRGRDGRVEAILGLAAGASDALEAADLERVHAVAAAGAERVVRLLAPFPGAADHLRAYLAAEHKGATDSPATIEGFLDVLLPAVRSARGDAAKKHVRALLGLDPVEGASPGDTTALAGKLGVTRQALYVSLGRLRLTWKEKQAEQIRAAAQPIQEILRAEGGAGSFDALAAALPGVMPHEPGLADGEGALLRAKALLRIVAEAGPTLEPEPLRLAQARIAGTNWLGESQSRLETVHELGEAASKLAQRDPLPSSDEVRRDLVQLAAASPLAALPADRLLALAAEASGDAALSARLELYPRGMPAERALRLSAGALAAEVTAADVRRTVEARYAAAAKLPERPKLDALMDEVQYAFDATKGRYQRKGISSAPDATKALSTRRATIHLQRTEADPHAVDAELFDQGIRDAVQSRAFRVLDVDQPWAEPAAAELSHRLRVPARSLDKELLAIADAVMREKRVAKQAVLAADRVGPTGPHWRKVTELMRDAADRLATSLLAEPGPVVLTHPGILARYALSGFLDRIDKATAEDQAPAFFLINPTWQQAGGPPPIDDVDQTLPIPAGRASRRVTVPAAWIQNKDRGGGTP